MYFKPQLQPPPNREKFRSLPNEENLSVGCFAPYFGSGRFILLRGRVLYTSKNPNLNNLMLNNDIADSTTHVAQSTALYIPS